MYFVVTGLGRGVAQGSGRRTRSLWTKALLLFLCDAALWLRRGAFLGLDFLGFIALAMLVIERVWESARPMLAAALLAWACAPFASAGDLG